MVHDPWLVSPVASARARTVAGRALGGAGQLRRCGRTWDLGCGLPPPLEGGGGLRRLRSGHAAARPRSRRFHCPGTGRSRQAVGRSRALLRRGVRPGARTRCPRPNRDDRGRRHRARAPTPDLARYSPEHRQPRHRVRPRHVTRQRGRRRGCHRGCERGVSPSPASSSAGGWGRVSAVGESAPAGSS